jgi:hypothetical protein
MITKSKIKQLEKTFKKIYNEEALPIPISFSLKELNETDKEYNKRQTENKTKWERGELNGLSFLFDM